MDISKLRGKQNVFLMKYKYVILVVLVGIILMIIPSQSKTTAKRESANSTKPTLQTDTAKELSAILSKIKGVGKVSVYLTTEEGERTIYQTDTERSDSETSGSNRSQTVIITDTNRTESGIIVQVNPPIYRGAIIVCQGGDDPAVQLAVVSAVSKATGLGANRISVLKMK